ncbi:CPBP family glutamic-type intramembrane protease [Paracoccus aminovorans]|uniref:CPBP family glutamic-type intramembrane protease n=1 Tax=Paracoccus aminovorans TaxID=34004 RepID=UPI0007850D0A|nr:CPBP family glutamic-type intramembrane protease [Paracoccus aminovorans]MDQ7776479.1 CPBP family glutamic-type intramembrane protease [Paracoccus aminovorans]
MNRALALAVLAAIPALAALFHLLGRSGLRPLDAHLAGLATYWALLALALARCGGWSLRLRRPSAAATLALAALVLAAALRWGTAPAQLSPGVLVVAALAAAANGALEEAFWRGALLPRPGRGAALAAGALFVAWHLAPAAGAALSGQDAARLLAGAALIAPVMTAARLSSGTAGTGALAHALVNFWVFSALAAANGHPL